MKKKGALILQDGSRYEGYLFGAEKPTAGEVIFTTAMTGYAECLTDPSFTGQILVCTYPILGSYGLSAPEDPHTGLFLYPEESKYYPKALIAYDYTDNYSHWEAIETLSEGMKRHGVTGLTGIDTRALTKKLRDQGPLLGKIVAEGEEDIPFIQPDDINLVAEVSTPNVINYPGTGKKIVLVDCGVTHDTIQHLQEKDLFIQRVPWDYDFFQLDFHGVFISNGPGAPHHCTNTVENIRKALEKGIPVAGIGLGNLLLAKALGLPIKKMRYGHHSHNHPVKKLNSTRCLVTTQNHTFVVDDTNLPKGWATYFSNMNDGSNEGLIHESGRQFSVQFLPEACGACADTEFIFADFVSALNK